MPPAAFVQYLLLPLIAGFLLVHGSFPRRYRAHHLLDGSRYPVYLLAVAVELYLLCFLWSLLLSHWLCDNFGWRNHCMSEPVAELRTELPTAFEPVPLATVPVALIVALFENLSVMSSRDAKRVREALQLPAFWRSLLLTAKASAVAAFMKDCNDSRLLTVYRAQIQSKPLLVTLKSRKVYVGIPNVSLDPTIDHRFLKLLPIASGIRDEKDATVQLTTFYDEISGALQAATRASGPLAHSVAGIRFAGQTIQVDTADVGTVISWNEIETLFIWDPKLYRLFAAGVQKQIEPPLWERLLRTLLHQRR